MGAAGHPRQGLGCALATVTPAMPGPGWSVRGSRHPASPGGRHRKQARPGCPGLPRGGQGRPSVRSGWVGSGAAGRFWAPGPQHREGLGGTVHHAVAKARDGDHGGRRSSAGWHLICPLDPTQPFRTRPLFPAARPHSSRAVLGGSTRGHPALENCQLPPRSGLTPGAAGQQAPLELQVAPRSSDTHVGTRHRTPLTDSPARLGGGRSQGESGQKRTQPASPSVTDPLGQHRTGGWHRSGPEILRHEANLSPLGWVERGKAPGDSGRQSAATEQ